MVQISGDAINIALSFLFAIIAILLMLRTGRYIRNELRIAPRTRIRDRFWIGFSMFLFSVILTVVVLFVAAMISSTVISNRAFLGLKPNEKKDLRCTTQGVLVFRAQSMAYKSRFGWLLVWIMSMLFSRIIRQIFFIEETWRSLWAGKDQKGKQRSMKTWKRSITQPTHRETSPLFLL